MPDNERKPFTKESAEDEQMDVPLGPKQAAGGRHGNEQAYEDAQRARQESFGLPTGAPDPSPETRG
jgi:hypothetical protein